MRKRVVVASGVVASVMAVVLGAPALAAGQTRAEIEEAARKASFRSEEEAAKAWEAELARKKAEAVAQGLRSEPSPLPANPPKTPWGHPDLRGYYITATYTPLQRPRNVDKPLYTTEEAIGAFAAQADTDASADPAVVHYDWKEFGMEAWQSPVRPNMRTALIVDPASGTLPALTPEAQKRRADAAALAKTRDHQTGVEIFANLYTRCILGLGAIPLVRGGQPGSTEATSAGVSTEIQIFQTPDHVVDRASVEYRRPHHPAGRTSASSTNRQAVEWGLARPMGGQYARRRDHQLQRSGARRRTSRDPPTVSRSSNASACSTRIRSVTSTRSPIRRRGRRRGRPRLRCRELIPRCTSSRVTNRITA